MSNRSQKKEGEDSSVAVLLCTYCGQKFLDKQLGFFDDQSELDWALWVSDDGSKDSTREILGSFQAKWGDRKVSIHQGPCKGFVSNFLSLAHRAAGSAAYYAFSDQDDIWDQDKLSRAINWLKTVPSDVPALYCSRTRLIDDVGHLVGLSPLFPKPPSFANALVQNIGGGNTMVFNDAACRLMISLGPEPDVVIHDWWAYLVVSGCGGRVHYDPQPSLSYRQHTGNLIGVNSGWASRILRIGQLLNGQHKNWNDRNIRALRLLGDKLTPENRRALALFEEARFGKLTERLAKLKRSGVYRQTFYGTIGLIVAVLLKKL